MSNAISTDLTPQFNITTEDGIKFHGKYWSMSRRRGGNVDFIDPRSGELLIVTDEELAGLIGSSQARIVRAGATEEYEKFAAATMDLSVLRSADIEDGRHRGWPSHVFIRRRDPSAGPDVQGGRS